LSSVAVLIPVLGRPGRVRPLVESLAASQHPSVPVRPVFLCSPGDDAQIAAVTSLVAVPAPRLIVVDWQPGRGDYAKKINHGFRATDDEWVLLAADDILFRPGWLEAALAVHAELAPCVIGTNDLGNPRVQAGQHSVYTLVHRAYGECGTVDDPTVLLHEGYWHNYVDDEFVQTAMARETWAHAAGSVIEHLHPDWGKGEMDDTYRRGKAHFADDGVLYQSRRRLWVRPLR
jgi:hypothetical protein